jgi:hypothetical protein
MPRYLPLASGLLILLTAGIVHGVWTQRWRPSPELQAAAARLEQVPLELNDWQGRDVPMEPAVIERAGLAACWTRRYQQAHTGRSVTVVLMCGRAGPTSVHTPEACYGGAGYRRTGASVRTNTAAATGMPAEFWTADFAKDSAAVPSYLRIVWGWGVDRVWSAPQRPRLSFAGHEALFKLYVLRETTGAHEPFTHDPCLEFLQVLLPVLDQSLFLAEKD